MGIYILLSFVLSNKIQRKIEANCKLCSVLNSLSQVSICQKKRPSVIRRKKAIYQAFFYNFLNDKGYDATTVQDIIDLADVGRSTFLLSL